MSIEDPIVAETGNHVDVLVAEAEAELAVPPAADPIIEEDVKTDEAAAVAELDHLQEVPTNDTVVPTFETFASTPASITAEQIAAVAGEQINDQMEVEEPIIIEEGAIWEPAENDVLSGRGANINSHPGNQKFRSLCFARKILFDNANHAAKRRIAEEIWGSLTTQYGSRFLKKRQARGPWYEMEREQGILKAAQVIRDYKRPDRILHRQILVAAGKKRSQVAETPEIEEPPLPEGPIVEYPEGVHENDVLCGRGAFVNGNTGNSRLRALATERKAQFDAGGVAEKRGLASDIVRIIKLSNGRFLKKKDGEWQELSSEKSVNKACQVMRDMDRADRKIRVERRETRKVQKKEKIEQTLKILGDDRERVLKAVSERIALLRPEAPSADLVDVNAYVDSNLEEITRVYFPPPPETDEEAKAVEEEVEKDFAVSSKTTGEGESGSLADETGYMPTNAYGGVDV